MRTVRVVCRVRWVGSATAMMAAWEKGLIASAAGLESYNQVTMWDE